MLLEHFEIFKRVDLAKIAGMNQAHEQITDVGPMLGFIKQGVFAVKDRLFKRALTQIVYGCRPVHPLRTVIQNTSQLPTVFTPFIGAGSGW